MHKNCIIIPLSDEFFEESVFPLLLQMRYDLLGDVVLQCFLEVVVQILRLIIFITQFENHSKMKIKVSK